jgi:hypothetical protein
MRASFLRDVPMKTLAVKREAFMFWPTVTRKGGTRGYTVGTVLLLTSTSWTSIGILFQTTNPDVKAKERIVDAAFSTARRGARQSPSTRRVRLSAIPTDWLSALMKKR